MSKQLLKCSTAQYIWQPLLQHLKIGKAKTKQTEFPKNIMEKINERRKVRKEWHRTRYPSDKTKFNRATKEYKDMTKEYENLGLQRHLSHPT